MTYYFQPPAPEEGPAGEGRLFYRFRINRGNTVIKQVTGNFYETRTPGIEELNAAEVFYQGGHKYPLTANERTDLIAAGYGAYITEES